VERATAAEGRACHEPNALQRSLSLSLSLLSVVV